jgi:hypothetical protein
MTLDAWLSHWLENIAAPTVRPKTYAGYQTAVRRHLIPGLGAHRIDRLVQRLSNSLLWAPGLIVTSGSR